LFVKDLNTSEAALQESLYKEVCASGKTVIPVINKSDIIGAGFKLKGEVLISCKTGEGIDALKKRMIKDIGLSALQEDDIIVTSAVHYEALLRAAAALEDAQKTSIELELAAENIRRALGALKELIGEVTSEDILDIIFSKFCVGK
jgi:Predicted GTPase